MMTPDNSALVRRRDSRDATGRPRAIPQAAKMAILHLLTEPGADLASAAKAALIPTERLRRYLHRPEVRRYLYDEKQTLIDAIAAGNPIALRDVRDNSGNAVARVNAARALEIMRAETEQSSAPGRLPQQAAGITIIIEAPGSTAKVLGPPVIDATADDIDDASLVYQDD
jgi:hypothetical protein